MINLIKEYFKPKTKGVILIPHGAVFGDGLKRIKRYAMENRYEVVMVRGDPGLTIRMIREGIEDIPMTEVLN